MKLASEAIADRWSQAVGHEGERLVVCGGAGTGKSRLIVARFLLLVERGLRPEQIGVAAPTRARARALRLALERRLAVGYERLVVGTPVALAELTLAEAHGLGATGEDWPGSESVLSAADRLAMLLERIDEVPLRHHDIGGNAAALIGRFVRRIDRLKAQLVSATDYARWASEPAGAQAGEPGAAAELEFAEVYRIHERMLAEAGVLDEGDVLRRALRALSERPSTAAPFEHLLIDDAHELDLAPARLLQALARRGLTVAGDPDAALLRLRGAGAQRLESFRSPGSTLILLERAWRSPERLLSGAAALVPGAARLHGRPGGEVCFWACAGERAQAQSVAADIERLLSREDVAPGAVAVLVPDVLREGRALAVALEERAIPHRLVGEAAFFQRAEIRDVLAWLRLLADPTDAAAVVRALARPPIELRSVDIARCTQIARRRKLDMVAALAAATESPQVPPEARERIRVFLKLYRSGAAAIDVTRPDLYVHRLIERLGLRHQQLFAAQADVVERLRALARLGELASDHARRWPQATPREFARRIAALADFGLREQEEPELEEATAVQVLSLAAAGGLEVEHVYVLGLDQGLRPAGEDPIPDALLHEALPSAEQAVEGELRRALYVALTRARMRAVLCRAERADSGRPAAAVEDVRLAIGGEWETREEELFGPAETLHSTYRLLRDELLQGTMRAGSRLGELRFDTDLDVSHAVVRYLELLKLAALIARPEGQPVAEGLRDVNARILQAVSAEQREIFTSSGLDDYLLDAERDARARAAAVAARDEPSLEGFLPLRGEGVVLSASDIDTYRTCPLKYKFARVFRIPAEPTIHQRFGILVHQVLERFHAASASSGSLGELLGLLEAGWRRGGFGDSEEERQLRGKATGALTRYHERFRSEESQPIWFERQFSFRLGPHLLRGRVDRVDRLPDGEHELIDYKTGRPKTATQLAEDVQLSLYALGAREAWELEASRQAYYYLLDDAKVSLPGGDGERSEWIRAVVEEVAAGIRSQGFEPTPSYEACSICDYRLICPAAER
jgi:DNA helicase-2/ATP-dependent DNA helicase PcrA